MLFQVAFWLFFCLGYSWGWGVKKHELKSLEILFFCVIMSLCGHILCTDRFISVFFKFQRLSFSLELILFPS